ncbi:MAG: Zn-dependent protease [Phycisphaerae bacterium]|nr:MAG: Zn-dependent protease [Phycisphaerae bacterium]
MLIRSVLVLLGAIVGIVAGGCQTNATTGRQQMLFLSLQHEAQLGAEAKPQMLAEMGPAMSRAEINLYVERVGKSLLAPALERDPKMASFTWEFTVLDSNVINAFALPGGKVFMSRGLMQKMTNEAQLAAVLGHEIGHVMARHGNERVSRTLAAQLGLEVAAAAMGSGESAQLIHQIAAQSTELFLMSYDRRQESESDSLGAEYMVAVGYDPMGAVQVMEILNAVAGSSKPPEILSTHPDPARRAEALRKKIANEFPQTQGNPAYKLKEAEFKSGILNKLSRAFPHAGEPTLAGAASIVPEGALGALVGGCDH